MFEFASPEELFKFQYEIPAFESLVQLPPNIASAHRIAHFYIYFNIREALCHEVIWGRYPPNPLS